MEKILKIFIVDIRRRLKKPLSIVLTMCIPLAMTVIIGSVFGRSGDVGLPRITMLLVDNDGAVLSMFVRQGLGMGDLGEMIDVVRVDEAEGERLMAGGKASAMVIIPDSFTVKVLDGEKVAIEVVKNPSESFLPLIIEEVMSTFAVIVDGGMKAFGDSMRRGRDLFLAEGWPSLDDMQVFLDEGRVSYAMVGPYVADSLVTIEDTTVAA
ncbi:MAG TPA: hypothetical protein VLA34_11080, partial [Candidatus Krumholzibacterium sp.]|nr:hypothetical protein [Candidatus Krumholzibacterium sp.]